jgi:predicted dehydrogenase
MTASIRIGIVGLGRGAALHHALTLQPGCEVVAVASLRPDRARAYAAQHAVPRAHDTAAQLIADRDVDAVVVASPAPDHAAQVVAALDAGRHVLSEVPAAWTLDECHSLVQAVGRARGKAIYMFGENANYSVLQRNWESIVAQGLIGKIVYAESQYVHDLRDYFRDADGNLTWRASLPPIQYCTHEIGPMLRLLAAGGTRDRCKQVTALHTGSNVAPDVGALDLEVGLFHTEGGAVLKVLCAFSIVREPWGHTMTVYGTHGCLETGRPEAGGRGSAATAMAYFDTLPDVKELFPLTLGSARRESPPEAVVPGGHGDGEYWMARDFVRAVRGEIEVPIDVYDAVDYTAPGICAHLSAQRGGAPVEIPDPRSWA